MDLEEYLDTLPEYAKDLRLNLTSLLRDQNLTPQQLWGTIVATGIASGNRALSEILQSAAREHLSTEIMNAARAAAAIMGMNNIYFRFTHVASHSAYASTSSKLRMNILRNHGTSALDFELWSLAVSAINGCSSCIDSHDKILRESGASEETILAAIRVASVVHGLSIVEI